MQRGDLDVYLLDYRGWGASSPRVPDEASIHADAWASWQAQASRGKFTTCALGDLWPLGGLLAWVGGERMASIDRIAAVNPPVWFLHGREDDTVPIALDQRLYRQAPELKHWFDWPLRHSNLQTDPTGRYAAVWRDIKTSCRQRR